LGDEGGKARDEGFAIQVKTDKRSGITSDSNQYSEDEQYIVKLVGQVTRVSLETVAILRALPELRFGD